MAYGSAIGALAIADALKRSRKINGARESGSTSRKSSEWCSNMKINPSCRTRESRERHMIGWQETCLAGESRRTAARACYTCTPRPQLSSNDVVNG